MKEAVYLDTTIPSFYFDARESFANWIEQTQRWWVEESGHYNLFISDAVIQELSLGNYPRKPEILEFIRPISVLEHTLDLEHIVAFYIENFVMPKSLIGDAVHLAYASYYNIDFLLTWNCNHLANAKKKKHIMVINARLGLSTPEIVTPLNLVEEKNDN